MRTKDLLIGGWYHLETVPAGSFDGMVTYNKDGMIVLDTKSGNVQIASNRVWNMFPLTE